MEQDRTVHSLTLHHIADDAAHAHNLTLLPSLLLFTLTSTGWVWILYSGKP